MAEDIFFQTFGAFAIRLREGRERSPDELDITFYDVRERIKKTYPISEYDRLYLRSRFSNREDDMGECRVCNEDDAPLVHIDIGFAVHEDCLEDLEVIVKGFFEEAPVEVMSRII